MTSANASATLERQIAQWREYLRRRAAIHGTDVDELEDHLRSHVSTLRSGGLDDDEAFLVAVKRMGNLDAVSREFAREHSERLWKQLVPPSGTSAESSPSGRADTVRMFALALLAAVAVKVPAMFGLDFDSGAAFYARNAAVLVLPALAAYFAWKRGPGLVTVGWIALGFAAAALFANVYPDTPDAQTTWLAAVHLPIALWGLIGVAYVGGHWFASRHRMDFVRFSGEQFIYYVLIALGGGVLTLFVAMLFEGIGVDAGPFIQQWLLPCGAAGAVIVAAWLVEAKQSVIENMAPVLTRLFTPLFTAVLLAFLVVMSWTGNPIDVARDMLIAYDVLLAMVVALVIYAVSARDPRAPPGPFDVLQWILIASALAVDAVALAAIAGRISEFGFTPNRVAALGENFILLANLAGAAWLHARFLRGRVAFETLERWQIAFLPVYCGWAALVVIAFPPAFGFR